MRSAVRMGIVLIALAGSALPACAAAQERQLQIAPAKPAAAAAARVSERRLALVIGNAAYKSSPLRNPVNDARAIAKALAATGFKVTLLENASQTGMRRAVRVFGDELLGGGVGLFYYAGHGMQVRGKNFLIPVNADIEREDEVEDQALDANLVLAKMDSAKNSLNLMILDACRNNPFARAFRSATQGLAQMDAPTGTLVAFATAPGSVAADGEGENGIYTKHLLANMVRAGLPIEQLFKEVRIGVGRETGDRQVPWESSSLKGDFFFVHGDAAPATRVQKEHVDTAIAAALRLEEKKRAAERQALQKQMELMVQQLLAKQRSELEGELRKQRGEAPRPAAAAPEPPVQVASLVPAPAGVGIDDQRFPRVGDSWDYTYVDVSSHTPVRRRARYAITAVSKEGIAESGGWVGGQATSLVHTPGPQIFHSNLWAFSPYLLSFHDPRPGESWGKITPLSQPRTCVQVGLSCTFSAKVVGMERVKVPAGTFDALRVNIDMHAYYPGGMNVRQLSYWYVARIKRYVKFNERLISGSSIVPDYDVELTSYKLH